MYHILALHILYYIFIFTFVLCIYISYFIKQFYYCKYKFEILSNAIYCKGNVEKVSQTHCLNEIGMFICNKKNGYFFKWNFPTEINDPFFLFVIVLLKCSNERCFQMERVLALLI